MSKWVLTACFMVAALGTLGGMSETAYGEDVYSPDAGTQNPDTVLENPDDGGGGLFGDFVAGVLGLFEALITPVLGFFEGFLPSLTGVWFIDDLLINPMLTYATYMALKVLLAVVN